METKLAFSQGKGNQLNHFWRRETIQLSVATIYKEVQNNSKTMNRAGT